MTRAEKAVERMRISEHELQQARGSDTERQELSKLLNATPMHIMPMKTFTVKEYDKRR